MAVLEVMSGPQTGMRFHLGSGMTAIGREPSSDIVITDPTVSRQHALVRFIEGRFHIYARSPDNALRVNGRPVLDQALQDGDEIGMGQTVFRLRIEGGGA